jgi:predicted ribosome quality control (RQC) complex YloA/Tae2 family protein
MSINEVEIIKNLDQIIARTKEEGATIQELRHRIVLLRKKVCSFAAKRLQNTDSALDRDTADIDRQKAQIERQKAQIEMAHAEEIPAMSITHPKAKKAIRPKKYHHPPHWKKSAAGFPIYNPLNV